MECILVLENSLLLFSGTFFVQIMKQGDKKEETYENRTGFGKGQGSYG